MKELTRFEMATCKRVAANTKSLKNKVLKLNEKIAELTTQRDSYLREIDMWEAPIITKYGCLVDDIISGAYLQVTYPEDCTCDAPCECECDATPNTEWESDVMNN